MEDLFGMIKHNETEKFLKQVDIYYNLNQIDINQTNEFGNTLLHMASRNRNIEIVEALIDKYDVMVTIQNVDGRTPLHLAVIYGMNDKAYNISTYNKINKSNKSNKYSKYVEKIESNSEKIISKLINKNSNVLMIEDINSMDPMKYYNTYSNLDSHKSLDRKYKSYKIKTNFFDEIKKTDPNGYKDSMHIYFLMKNNN